MTDTADQLFLGRQPILDCQQRLYAYELLFRNGSRNAADIVDGVYATATVIVNAFAELGLSDVLGNCRGFINVDENFLFSDVLELLPPASVVLEILETVPPTPRVVERCQALKKAGFSLALDDVVQVQPAYADLIHLVDIIKVDVQLTPQAELAPLAAHLRPLGKVLLAEKVESREQMNYCLDLGFSLFQGYFFAKPTIIAGKKLEHSHLGLMKLLGLILSDADFPVLEAALKPQPGLTLNLLRLTNSVGAGARVPITSLRHALVVLGQRQLQRWLQLLLFASGGPHGPASPLLMMAAARGRLLELLAQEMRPKDAAFADQAFMVGIMSLMPALLGLPMADIVSPLGLPAPVQQALCKEEGPLGALLQLAESGETGHLDELRRHLDALPALTLLALNRAVSQSLAWANAIAQEQMR